MNFYFHPWPLEIVIHIWLSVMAVAALTIVSTLQPRVVAFAVFFPALGFLACAPPSRHYRWNPVKVVRMPKIHQLLCVVNVLHVLLVVLACHTYATWITSLSLRETLAIQFQAINFRTFTPLLLNRRTWGQIEMFNGFHYFLILLDSAQIDGRYGLKGERAIFQEHIKEVFPWLTIGWNLIKFWEVDELKGTGTGRGMSWWQFKIHVHIWL